MNTDTGQKEKCCSYIHVYSLETEIEKRGRGMVVGELSIFLHNFAVICGFITTVTLSSELLYIT